MNKIKNLMTISALSIMVLILPAIVSAQYGGSGNGGYNNGQYGNNGYYTNIKPTVRNLKDRSKDLKKEIDRLDDRRNNGGWNNGGWNNGGWNNGGYNNVDIRSLKHLADQFRKAADKLEDKYDDGRDQYKSTNEARRVLELGSQLDREIRRGRLNLYNWNQISNDLRIVANAYNGRNNNGGWGNGNGNGNGGWGNGRGGGGRPSWWPF